MLKFPADEIIFSLTSDTKERKVNREQWQQWAGDHFSLIFQIQFCSSPCFMLAIWMGRSPSCSDESLAFPVSLIKGRRGSQEKTVCFRSELGSWGLQTHRRLCCFMFSTFFSCWVESPVPFSKRANPMGLGTLHFVKCEWFLRQQTRVKKKKVYRIVGFYTDSKL